jgi:hypothetical protein
MKFLVAKVYIPKNKSKEWYVHNATGVLLQQHRFAPEAGESFTRMHDTEEVLVQREKTFECDAPAPAFPAISTRDVYEFLGDWEVWFNRGDKAMTKDDRHGPCSLVGSLALFRDRVRRLHAHHGVVYLQLEPLHRDATPEDKICLPYNGQVHGEPYVWDVYDSLDLFHHPDDFRVFRMYFWDEKEHAAVKMPCPLSDRILAERNY